MGIGTLRRHYGNEEEGAAVFLDPQPTVPDAEGGVVAIGDEPGTARTPMVADAAERNLEEAPASEDAPNAPDANEAAASADQNGDPATTTDPEGHPPVVEVIAENLEAKGEPHGDVLTGEPAEEDNGSEVPDDATITAESFPDGPDLPKRNASRQVWADYAEAVGVAVADTEGRDDIAARFYTEK